MNDKIKFEMCPNDIDENGKYYVMKYYKTHGYTPESNMRNRFAFDIETKTFFTCFYYSWSFNPRFGTKPDIVFTLNEDNFNCEKMALYSDSIKDIFGEDILNSVGETELIKLAEKTIIESMI